MAQCVAHTKKSGGTIRCGLQAIKGGTVCMKHGGRAPQVKAAAERRRLVAEVLERAAHFGDGREIDPALALEEELQRTAGHVGWLGLMVSTRTPAAPFDEQQTYELYSRERNHLAGIAKACLAAGIDERRIRIAEQQANVIADAIRKVYDDPELGLTAEQKRAARTVTAKHLRLVAGGQAG